VIPRIRSQITSLVALLLVAGACGEDQAPPERERDPSLRLDVDGWVAIPYATIGEDPAVGTLEVRNLGDGASTGGLNVEVDSPFAVDGDLSPLEPHETRTFDVYYALRPTAARFDQGTITVSVDGSSATAGVSAAMGDPELGPATWQTDDWGTWTVVDLPSAPFPDGAASYDDSSVLIALPPGYADSGELTEVTHLHGHNAILEDVVAEQYIREQLALSGRNAVLIAPQGAEDAADSDFGKLDLPGGHLDLVQDVVCVLYRDGLIEKPGIGMNVLSAHSGGYNATANILQAGGLDISAVHLFDALYGRQDVFADFVRAGGTLRSVYTAAGGTADLNQALAATLAAEGQEVSSSFADGELQAGALTIGPSDASHGGTVYEERAWARWLTATGAPARPTAPPELLYAVADGKTAQIAWRGESERTWRVESSSDGDDWSLATDTAEASTSATVAQWLRVLGSDVDYGTSDPSDRYGASGTAWLVVDGFDRVLGGSWSTPTHDFVAQLGPRLTGGYSAASNEAVAEGLVDLTAFEHVLWLLGDESTDDHTFTDAEQDAVAAYVDAGGSIVVSGSEVGYATGAEWLASTLHATFVKDDSGTVNVEAWRVGDAYEEDYPDVLAGDETIWTYGTGEPAAVGWDGRVVVIGFGLENFSSDEQEEALADLEAWLGL
jgi:hypothetical protein